MPREKLLAGYAKLDITPKDPVPLGGYGASINRFSTRVLDPLYATAVAVTGTNGETAILMSIDSLSAPLAFVNRIQEKAADAIGIPKDHILISATHTHSAPDQALKDVPELDAYREYYVDQAAKACVEAYEDRRPAKMYHGGKPTAGLNFVRHYVMEDGTYAGANMGDFSKRVVGYTADPDRRLRLVQFRREVGKDILLANFQAHPCCTGGTQKFDVSADFIGVVRSRVEAATGCDFAYLQGACGNVNMVTWWRGQRVFGSDENEPYGEALAAKVLEAMTTLRPIDGTEVHVRTRDYEARYDHSQDGLAETAKQIYAYYVKTYDRKGADKMAKEHGWNSVHAAGSVASRAKYPVSLTQPISAVSVGNVGFVGAPYEMFSQSGLEIRDKSPMGETVIMTNCNGLMGYLAVHEAFRHGCYEVDNHRFVEGTAEELSAHFLEMLRELKEEQAK